MKRNYLGTVEVDISTTEYKDYTPTDWALMFIYMYGQIDGAHHKQWVLDQVTRILNDAPVYITEARWEYPDNPETENLIEHRFNVGTSEKYEQWVKNYEGEIDEYGDSEYSYDDGIAP
jgi:hypothetical protein